jgi:hydroxymethylbilane synthase
VAPELSFELVDVPGARDAGASEHPILEALAAGMFDLHVRGARELPVLLPEGIVLAACTERVDPFDVLIARGNALLEDLPEKAAVGVESARVKVQLEDFREDLTIQHLEGTVDRLLERLNQGAVAGIIVAAEDVEIFGWENAVSEIFPPDILLPAAGQGSFGFVAREDDSDTLQIARKIDHRLTRQIVLAERAFLRELDVRITDPVAVHGSFEGDTLVLEALLGDEASGAILRDDLDGSPDEEEELGIRLAKLFVADGARDYLASYK